MTWEGDPIVQRMRCKQPGKSDVCPPGFEGGLGSPTTCQQLTQLKELDHDLADLLSVPFSVSITSFISLICRATISLSRLPPPWYLARISLARSSSPCEIYQPVSINISSACRAMNSLRTGNMYVEFPG
jgi:hypothetical protein